MTSHADTVEQVQNEPRTKRITVIVWVTTLDVNLQQAAYEELGGFQGAVVVMDVKNR